MGNRDLTLLNPQMVELWLAFKKAAKEIHHVDIILTDGYRSPEEQDALYAQGRTKPGKIVTNAKAWASFHNHGRAFDIAFQVTTTDQKTGKTKKTVTWQGPWAAIGKLGASFGLQWGGYWKKPDRPHFQFLGMGGSMTLAKLNAARLAK